MSSFTSPLVFEALADGKRFKLVEPVTYDIGRKGSGNTIAVPVGFETDLTSTPRIMWPIIPRHGKYSKAAVLHDYLYQGHYSRWMADAVFLEALAVLQVGWIKRYLMFFAVRAFGWWYYREGSNEI